MMTKDKSFLQYIQTLAEKRIFKILPLYEEKNEGVFKYIQSLLYELYGLQYVFEDIESENEYVILLATFESLSTDCLFFDVDKEDIKREVFKCINITEKIYEKYANGGVA